MSSPLAGFRVGYAPYSSALTLPGDRRRFAFYAERRGVGYEIADPDREYDLVVLSERADILTWSRRPLGTRIVYDLIDAYLSLPRRSIANRLRGVARFLGGELRRPTLDYHSAVEAMCRRADAVVCSTPEQRTQISEHCANVHVVLDAHGADVRMRKTDYGLRTGFDVVWEGLPYTLDQLAIALPALRELASSVPVTLHVVTDPATYRLAGRWLPRSTESLVRRLFAPAIFHRWDRSTLSAVVTACDVAIIPLRMADPFAAGKPENKLLLLWGMGMPVVASATPAYRRAMDEAGVATYCRDDAEWAHWLSVMWRDRAMREETGRRGQVYVEREHTDEHLLARWDRVFASVLR
ncbi:MAG: hypothetical protein ACRDF0_02025 [Candidatus Limnocylindria bacterium]